MGGGLTHPGRQGSPPEAAWRASVSGLARFRIRVVGVWRTEPPLRDRPRYNSGALSERAKPECRHVCFPPTADSEWLTRCSGQRMPRRREGPNN